jgi:hypothetical protein
VTLIEGLELQHAQQSTVRRGHMDIAVIHVNLTDARACGKTCYGPIEPSGQHSFMEEVSILTLSMFFIVIYLFCIMCIYIDILLYVVLQLLRPSSRPSTPMDASVPSPTTDATIEASCSLGAPHTQVCVTFDKFTIVISLFYGILKFLMFLCFYRIWD